MRKNSHYSTRRNSRGSDHSPQEYRPLSVSTKDFRWLHSEGWDGRLSKYFAANHSQLPLLIFAAPAFVHSRPPGLQLVGRWILTSATSDEPESWVEAQVITGSFQEIWFFVGERTSVPWFDASTHAAELSLLISAVSISLKPDIMNFAFTSSMDRTRSASSLGHEWGEVREIMTPLVSAPVIHLPQGSSVMRTIKTIRINRTDWENSSIGRRDRATLNYLVKKTEQKALEGRSRLKTRHRSILGSLILKFLKSLRIGRR